MVLSKTTASDEGVDSGAMSYTTYLPLRSRGNLIQWKRIHILANDLSCGDVLSLIFNF